MSWEKHLEHLRQACQWAGIQQGRSRDYIRLLCEFREDNRRSREHLLAVYESVEITAIFDLWQSQESNFPRLKAAVARAFKKGRTINQDELLEEVRGHPRNDLFVYMMAGQLFRGGAEVLCVDGIPRKDHTLPESS